ncbi:hypothetical protein N9T20_00215 [bacterium]|nr:hypothetical protein [bacterium]
MSIKFKNLNNTIVKCKKCPRLVKFIKKITIEKRKQNINEVPENLIEEEVKVLSQGMDDKEAKKNKVKFTETAKTRIKTGLILNEFGEQNKIQVTEQEIQAEVQKQLRMMPGQEKNGNGFLPKKSFSSS